MTSLNRLRQQLSEQRHRQLVVISGSASWQQNQIQELFGIHEKVFWIGSKSSEDQDAIPLCFKFCGFEAIESKRLPYYLGQEIDGAIFDVNDGISADALGIVSGMIKSGGLLIVLAPIESDWLKLNNHEDARFLNTPYSLNQAFKHFSQHLINSWHQEKVIWLSENSEAPKTYLPDTNSTKPQTELSLPTQDQLSTIEKIKSVAFGHRKRPLVITADRGRGKTAALGLAAIECLLEGKQHICISASRPDQVKTAFEIAADALSSIADEIEITVESLKSNIIEFHYEGELKTFSFQAPDELILKPTSADLLMVDEAAHLPTPLLIELLQRHHRMVFSTTQHGYEGSGRGFALRFTKFLDEFTPDWKHHTLTQPIRWNENDPLEQVIFDTLLLNVQIPTLHDNFEFNPDTVNYEFITSQQLLDNTQRMQQLFALLVQAHYQTSPNDLQQLLNAPNIHIGIALQQDSDQEIIIGAALLVEEGKVNPSKNHAHGHLVPQLLTRHYAQEDFQMLSTLRVMRIAVHPNLQRKGIGLNLIAKSEQFAVEKRIDYLSSSFGGSNELLPFWFKLAFWPLHVGAKRDKASGSYNIVVAKPISAMSRQALSLIQTRFQEQFPHLLLESLPHLPTSQVLQIVQTFRFKTRNYGLEKAVLNYQCGLRPYESISHKLWEWSLQSAQTIQQGSLIEQSIWSDKILKRQDWQQVAHRHHLSGRKGVEKELKSMIETWLKAQPCNMIKRI